MARRRVRRAGRHGQHGYQREPGARGVLRGAPDAVILKTLTRAFFALAIGAPAGCVEEAPSGPAVPDIAGSASGSRLAPPGAGLAPSSAGPGPSAAAPSSRPVTTARAETPTKCREGMAMVPGGRLRPWKKRIRIDVQPFCLDVMEVSVADYTACARSGRCAPECRAAGKCELVPARAVWGDPMESARASAFCNGGRADRDRHPMNCVSVPEAEEYCRARGGRLPLAAEWEWAARGAGARTRYPWGNADVGGQLCWGRPQPRRGTCPIGNHPADTSPQGILDLAGNVCLLYTSPSPRDS